MIRIYIKIVSSCPDGSVTGCHYHSFDLDAPTLEAFLKDVHGYMDKSVIGAEVLE